MKPRFNFGLAGGMLALSVLAILIFRTMKEISVGAYIAAIVIYSAITLASSIWYIFFNRGLIGKLSPEMLPAEWDEAQKKSFMDEYYDRRSKSKWAIMLLVPMIATFFFELLDIYFLRSILEKLDL